MVGRILGFPFQVKFRWLSPRTLWLAIFLISSCTLALLTIKNNIQKLEFASFGGIIFYLLATIYLVYFLWLSLKWPGLRDRWSAVEEKMSAMPKVRVHTTVAVIVTSFFIVGLCEHALSILDNTRHITKMKCSTSSSTLETYYRLQYAVIFHWLEYAHWKGAITSLVVLMLTVLWTFTDVFAISLAIVLGARFKQLKVLIEQVKGKEMSESFWKQTRERYVDLSLLAREIDQKISLLIFLSLGSNIYSVVMMLINVLSVKTNYDYVQTAYYGLSFVFVLMRLTGACVYAARIHDHCTDLLPLLFAVPSSTYCIEVHRFIMHVRYYPVTLTAFNFFSITRSTFLKIAGSILTYEIVLIQFELLNADETKRRPVPVCPE